MESRIGPKTRRFITSADTVYVSAATVLELIIKSLVGKLEIPDNPTRAVAAMNGSLLDITARHAEGLKRLPQLIRHDPFDRILVAQAMLEQMTLVTVDGVLLSLGLACAWNVAE